MLLVKFIYSDLMEGLGFRNWGDRATEDSYESSPPTYSSDPYGFDAAPKQKKKTSKNNDIFDYDIYDTEKLSSSQKRCS